MTTPPARTTRSARRARRSEGRPKPLWRSVGYLLYGLAWLLAFLGTVAVLVVIAVEVARGAVGPFSGNPLGGMIILVVLGGPFVGWLFFLSPLVSATQALLGLALLRASIGGTDDDPPLAENTGRRIPVYAPVAPTSFTRRLVSIGRRGRAPSGRVLAIVFTLGAICITAVFALGWN